MLFFSIIFSCFSLSAGLISAEFQPSSEVTYLSDNVTLGTSEGTWCALNIRSASNGIGGIGSYMFNQIDSKGVVEGAPLIGASRVWNAYKFILQGDDLTVEIREVPSGKLLCTLSGTNKKVSAKGTWVWPTATPLEGANFCDKTQTMAPGQKIEPATLEVDCK